MGIHNQSYYNLMDRLGIEYPKRTRKPKTETKKKLENKKNTTTSNHERLFPDLPQEHTLSTGEMVDYLVRFGGQAETAQGMRVEFSEKESHIKAIGTGKILQLDRMFLLLKWRVLPNIVTFDEAITAYEQGHAVKCLWNKTSSIYLKENGKDSLSTITFPMIREGEWIVAKIPQTPEQKKIEDVHINDLVT